MKNFVAMILVVGLVVVTAQAAGVHFSLIETAPGTWGVYAEIGGSADTLGISAYALWVFDIVSGSVSYEESNLFTLDEYHNISGFTNASASEYDGYPIGSGETSFNIGNQQSFVSPILGIGLTPVNETTTPPVQLGVPALLGVLTTPEGLGIDGKPAGVDTWVSPDFGLDTPGVAFLNLAGDGYLSTAEMEYVTYSATPFIQPMLLAGDANGDGVVSDSDYSTTVSTNFGNTGEEWSLGDANADGVVSAADYSSIQSNFGDTSAEMGGTVPEPATLGLLVLGGLALLRRKGNRAV